MDRPPDRATRSNNATAPRVVIACHAFMQNVRRGHYELGVEAEPRLGVAAAFEELGQMI